MNEPRRTQNFSPPEPGWYSASPQDAADSVIDYPAYADEMPYAYGGRGSPWAPGAYPPNPTQQLPSQYWQQDQPPSDEPPGSTPPPGSPRWLWFVAGAAVLLVIGLVIALVVTNSSDTQQTAIEPLPPMPGPSTTFAPPTTRTAPPSTTRRPPRTTTTEPGTTVPPTATVPGTMQSVVYSVTGEGRAISVMYMDTGDLIQTEFNVTLPWTKQVSLSTSATHPASVTIVNIGHNVTCSVTVAGVQVRQRTGQGLTICDAPL